MIQTKICSQCNIKKPLSEFNKKNRNKDRLRSSCRDCDNKYKQEHQEQINLYKLLHKEEIRKYKVEYYQKHKKLISIRDKKYRKKNKEKISHNLKKYNAENTDKIRNTKLQKIFGITLIDYNQMLEEQNYLCVICGNKETVTDKRTNKIRKLSVDHDHQTGRVRGLLCGNCNNLLGRCKDNIKILQSAINYLQRGK
jgi:hypothetical protein